MRPHPLTLGLFCALLTLACSTADEGSHHSDGHSSTDGGTSTHGSTDGHTSHHGDTIDLTTDGTGSSSTGDATTGHDHTTGSTGHDHTTGSTGSTGHDHTTADSTGHDTHDTPGTTHDTTGGAGTCADLDEAGCLAHESCSPIYGSQIFPDMKCVGPHTFHVCIDAIGCDDLQTVACDDAKTPWLFPSSCIPDGFAACDAQPFDTPCK